jgi:hypothetical protein
MGGFVTRDAIILYVLLTHYYLHSPLSCFIEFQVHLHLFPFVVDYFELQAIVFVIQLAIWLQFELFFMIIFLVRILPWGVINKINGFFLILNLNFK